MDRAVPKSPLDLRRRIDADPTTYFTVEEVDRSKRYVRPLQIASLGSLACGIVTMVAIIAARFPQTIVEKTGVSGWVIELLVIIAALSVLLTLCDLPIAVWKTFVHETKWGFNKQTPKMFVLDLIKSTLIYGLILQAMLLVPVWALIRATDLWWLWGGLVITSISLILAFVYPVLILPAFNKFTPLEEGPLRARLRELAARAGVNISEFDVMDASKRSTKDNAFFVGMGSTRRVVLYDNMLSLPDTNTEVVVAHEIGHWRRGHITRNLVMGVVRMPLLLGATAAVVSQGWFLRLAGVDSLGDPAAMPALFSVAALLFIVIRLFDASISRWFEREADFDALELTRDPASFEQVWRNMIDRNLPDLTPSWWVRVRATHPPIHERLAHGRAWASANPDVRVEQAHMEPQPGGAPV